MKNFLVDRHRTPASENRRRDRADRMARLANQQPLFYINKSRCKSRHLTDFCGCGYRRFRRNREPNREPGPDRPRKYDRCSCVRVRAKACIARFPCRRVVFM
jgi:hypothetical protein